MPISRLFHDCELLSVVVTTHVTVLQQVSRPLSTTTGCRLLPARLSRNVVTTANCRRDWTVVGTRSTLVVADTRPWMTISRPLWLRQLRRQSPAKFWRTLKTGRTRWCRRLRSGTMIWRWTYQHRPSSHPRLSHQEVCCFAYLSQTFACIWIPQYFCHEHKSVWLGVSGYYIYSNNFILLMTISVTLRE